MNALPALSMIATDAIRRQFAAEEPRVPDRRPAASAPPRARLALAALLERAAHAVAPAGYRPAH
jgi:hypothetical protein